MRDLYKYLLPLMVLAAVAGCATNPITGRSQLMVVPERMAIGESAAAYNSMMGDLGKKKKIENTDSERAKKVREITDKLIAQAVRFRPDSANWKWEVQVINDPQTVNAFCMAGGKMAIYSGMWEKLKATDEEIAHVMGHEIGHALANHTQERMSVAYGTGITTSIAAIALGARDQTAALMQQAGGGANERVVNKPGELTREEYAKQAANDTLSFLSEPFERFKSGNAVFDCTVNCSFSYSRKKGDWQRLHAAGAWRDVAVSVMQVGYLSDLSYFMLAEAARGLGLNEAAATYYKRALEAGKEHACGRGVFSCEGFEVQKLAAAALR